MEITFARSATRHRVSRIDSAYVVTSADRWVDEPPPADGHHRSIRLLFVGRDTRGRMLEVMAVEESDGALKIIHAMPVRLRILKKWKEANS